MKASTNAISFLETLRIPEGPKAGELVKLAPFQKQTFRGALAEAWAELGAKLDSLKQANPGATAGISRLLKKDGLDAVSRT